MEAVIQAHKKEYGVKPDVIVSAPCRFHLMGDHTWFFRDKTLSMGVDLPVYVAVSKRSDYNLKFCYEQLDEQKHTTLQTNKFKKEDKWANAIKSIVAGYQALGFTCPGMEFTVYSDVLPSAGFGVTTAIKVASAWAIKELNGFRCSEANLLKVIETANRKFLQIENHKEDNFSCIYSKANSMILTDHNNANFDIIPFPYKDKVIVLTDAQVPRVTLWNEESLLQPENVLLLGELKSRSSNVYGGWKYEDNTQEINEVLSVTSEETKRRLLCVMNEHKYILDAVNSVGKKDFASFARAVNRSYENMRDLYELSCPEIDWILKRVQTLDENPEDVRNPVNCGRITGKGFGRCTYSILRASDVDKYKAKLEEYSRIFGFDAKTYIVKPSKGVQLV